MIPLKDDNRQAALVEKRRKLEEERRLRIFNPRQRIMGIDKQTLDKQVEEKKWREMEEKKLSEEFDKYMIQNDRIAVMVDRALEEERRKINKDIIDFRATFQGPATRREYELYDPQDQKRSLPARVSDDDPRCGGSSGQIFGGEDLCCRERLESQKTQTKAWLEQQMYEKVTQEHEQRLVDKAFEDARVAMDKRAIEIEKLEERCRRKLNESLVEYNLLLAEEKLNTLETIERKEQEDNAAEICNSMMGDLLCENTQVCQSNLGPNRVLGTMYKGMSDEERLAIRQGQLEQMAENARRQTTEFQVNAEWEKIAMEIERQTLLREQQEEKQRRQIAKDIVETNRVMGEEQKSYQQFLDKNIYKTRVSDDFFFQFNTTTR